MKPPTPISESIDFGGRQTAFETGEIGRQADATVLVNMDDTVVMTSVTVRREPMPNASFLPLTVDFQEKFYAAGKIPGSFFRREGRPSEKEILTCRLIDRSIRPLFPKFFYHEIQVVCTLLSLNPEVDGDLPAMLSAYAALELSGVPFAGPVGAARVGFIGDQPVVNPTISQMEKSRLNLYVAGTPKGVLMVESEAKELSEAQMLASVMAGHSAMQGAIEAVVKLGGRVEKPDWAWWRAPELPEERRRAMRASAAAEFGDAYQITEKPQRAARVGEIRDRAREAVAIPEPDPLDDNLVNSELKKLESEIVRERILSGEKRIDGRGNREVRPLAIRVGVLPRTHGSALFTRGETQALAVATLGASRDEQKIDSVLGEYFDPFMLHYNFPPYATGETGRIGTPKRREIGHGKLAKRALMAVLPDLEKFGYPLRLVSEITESNGSSSMATVCGGSLALMDAGVPLKKHVAGIAMGLIKGGESFAVLSDILGDEDHLGDMDFKVAGTEDGVTALQMDLKIDSINEQIMGAALEQALEGRLWILRQMKEVLAEPRAEVSPYAPSILRMKVAVSKIRDVIGKGGSVIRGLTEETGTKIDIEDDGSISISGPNYEVCERAKAKIDAITFDLEVGRVYDGKVETILDNVGAVVSIFPGKDGLLHISQISKERVSKVSDHLEAGQSVRVKVIKAEDGKVRFTLRGVEEGE